MTRAPIQDRFGSVTFPTLANGQGEAKQADRKVMPDALPDRLSAAASEINESLPPTTKTPATMEDVSTHDDLLAFAADEMFRAADEIKRIRRIVETARKGCISTYAPCARALCQASEP